MVISILCYPYGFHIIMKENIKWRMVLTGKPKLDKISMVIPWEININSSFSNLLNKENENMIGIYKITNKENGKAYIGQSNNIERRFLEHCYKGEKARIPLDIAIQKYGKDAFNFEILEECPLEKLNQKEAYWIKYYNTVETGYNCSEGGDQQSVGKNNGRSKLTEEDIVNIRKAYANHEKQKEVYKKYENIISFNHFQNIWQGRVWSYIMPEVFTEENKKYYIYQNSLGGNGASAQFTNEEVIALRKRYVNESAKEIYKDYQDRVKYQTFQAILWGRTYKNLPIYKKKEKKWINI